MSITITSSAPADSLTDTPLATAGLDTFAITLLNQATDTCNLRQAPATWTGAPLITQGATITIKEAGTPVFIGVCLTDPRTATAVSHTITYQIAGPWYWLDTIDYRQRHRRWTAAGLDLIYMADIILNQAENGTSITTGTQISNIIAYAIAQGAPIAKGTIATGLTLPWESAGPIKCSEAIRRMLTWSPDHIAWWDYNPASGHPILNITPRASMSTATVNLADYTTTQASIRPRYDLQLPGVEIQYNITQTVAGITYLSTNIETAGNPADPHALHAVIPLAGSSGGTAQFQEIVISNLPTGDWLNTDKAWWKARVPALAAYANADMDLRNPAAIVQPGPDETFTLAQLPNILEEGTITPWMAEGGINSAPVTITIKLDATERDNLGQIVRKIVGRTITLRLTGTNALTRRYSRSEFSEYSETIPTGIAAALYSSLSILPYDGQLTLTAATAPSGYRPGQLLHITGGRTEWQTMPAIIQSVTRSTADGTCAITIGPAKHLGIDDLARLRRRIRNRKVPYSYTPRQTGLAGDDAALAGGRAPKNEATAEAGKPIFELYEPSYESGSPPAYIPSIEINPAAITSSDPAQSDPIRIKPREVTLAVMDGDTTGKIIRAQIMTSEPYYPPGAEDTPAADGFLLVPKISGSQPAVLVWDGTVLAWVTADAAYKEFQRKADDTLAFDYVRWL